MRSPSRAAAALLFLTVAFAVLSVASTFSRSLVPHHLDATVADVELRREKHPGIDDVWLIHFDDGRRLHVDAEIAKHVPEGTRVTKERWETTLHVGARPVPLELSDDAIGMLWVMPLTVLAAAGAAATSLSMNRDLRPRP